jgi:hypothetical protein
MTDLKPAIQQTVKSMLEKVKNSLGAAALGS